MSKNNIAFLSNDNTFTSFEYNDIKIRFRTSPYLECYKKILEWDNGYLVVIAKYGDNEIEEYIDLVPVLQNLYFDAEKFLEPIKEVSLQYA